MLNFKRITYTLVNLFFILSSFIFFHFQIFHTWYEPDEAVFLLGGRLLHNGFVLYKDYVDNKPPLIFLLSYFLSSLSLVQLRIFMFLILILSVLILYEIMKNQFDKNLIFTSTLFLLFLISFPYFDVLTLRLEQLLLFFSALSLYFYFKRGNLFLSSLFLSFFPFLKPTYVVLWLVFFFMDKRLILPTLSLSLIISLIFLVIYGKDMLDAIFFLSLLKLKSFHSIILKERFNLYIFFEFIAFILSFPLILHLKNLLKTRPFNIILFLAIDYLFFSLFGFFFVSPYLQAFTVFIFFMSIPFFVAVNNFLRSLKESQVSFLFSITIFVLIFIFLSITFFFLSQFENMKVNSTRGFSVVGDLSKEDASALKMLKLSGKDVYIASKDASVYYPFFVDKAPHSILPSEVLKKDGLFVCFTGCMGLMDGEYENLLDSIDKNINKRREFIIFDRIIKRGKKCYSAGLFCMNSTYITSLLNSNNYSLYYSGNSIEIYHTTSK